eukprot:PhF_6_TR41661/c0_g1_i2/m.63159
MSTSPPRHEGWLGWSSMGGNTLYSVLTPTILLGYTAQGQLIPVEYVKVNTIASIQQGPKSCDVTLILKTTTEEGGADRTALLQSSDSSPPPLVVLTSLSRPETHQWMAALKEILFYHPPPPPPPATQKHFPQPYPFRGLQTPNVSPSRRVNEPPHPAAASSSIVSTNTTTTTTSGGVFMNAQQSSSPTTPRSAFGTGRGSTAQYSENNNNNNPSPMYCIEVTPSASRSVSPRQQSAEQQYPPPPPSVFPPNKYVPLEFEYVRPERIQPEIDRETAMSPERL